MKSLPLSKGYFALVDDEDYELVSQYKWTAMEAKSGIVYAYRKIDGKNIYLHRYILGCDGDFVVDHIDHNGLNNQRANLRISTQRQNLFNAKAKKNAKSIYKGVSWCTQKNRWVVRIVDGNGKRRHGGFFDDELMAANTYNLLSRQFHGEYVCNEVATTNRS